MGIESDQVVYEYLSRVGDLAQQQQLPSAARVRLVTELRNEIDRRRSKAPVDSPSSVRRIIARLGTPDEVVAAAGSGGSGGVPDVPHAAVPGPRAEEPPQRPAAPPERPKGLRRVVPRPRRAEPRPEPAPGDGPARPGLAGPGERGGDTAPAGQTDWWRVDGGPPAAPRPGTGTGPGTGSDDGPYADLIGLGDSVPGFIGGVEIPELLKPPPRQQDTADGTKGKGEGGAPDAAVPRQQGTAVVVEKAEQAEKAEEGEKAAPRLSAAKRLRSLVPKLRPGGGWTNPLLLVAAALLVAGAFVGSLVPLILGWLIAYLSRRLTRVEAKWAVFGVPGAVAAAGVVWLWGRTEGRWGDPIAEGQMDAAIEGTWPWVLRGAAVASALFLLWRSQRAR